MYLPGRSSPCFLSSCRLGGSVVREKISGSFIRLKNFADQLCGGLLSKQITYVGVTMVQAIVIFSLGIWVFPLLVLPV